MRLRLTLVRIPLAVWCQPQSFTACPTWVWLSAEILYWYINLCVFTMLSIIFSNSKTFERRFILFENTFFYIWTTQEWMRLSWTLVRIRLRCDANHSLSLCARPRFGSALDFYIDTLIHVCLQCVRSILWIQKHLNVISFGLKIWFFKQGMNAPLFFLYIWLYSK